jgi:tRNA(fMet)-specific endonuclease VapC
MMLLDTDVCIELLKGNKRVLQRRDQYDGPVGICFMTIAELIPILKRFGTIKADLQKQGMPVADADVLIAAATLEKAERLVTGNAKHFERIAGLVLEDWR